jgi:hypothetical protein
MAKIPFLYRDFYDVPRMLLMEYGEKVYLFDCKFDEQLDDYPDRYQVYVLRDWPPESVLSGDWGDICSPRTFVGTAGVHELLFDSSRRECIDDKIFGRIREKANQ